MDVQCINFERILLCNSKLDADDGQYSHFQHPHISCFVVCTVLVGQTRGCYTAYNLKPYSPCYSTIWQSCQLQFQNRLKIKDSVTQHSKPVYGEHQQYKLKRTFVILIDSPGYGHFCYCRYVYLYCYSIFVNTLNN